MCRHYRAAAPAITSTPLRHLNRDDFIKYPDGVAGLGEAIQHRIDHAGLTRKVGKNQVLALNVLLSSDGEALRRLADEGRLNEWAEASVSWAKETFGAANVVGAHLHMDEQTPHLHVTVVPIVTTERRRKASEAKATKRYRTSRRTAPAECRRHHDTRQPHIVPRHLRKGDGAFWVGAWSERFGSAPC